MSDREVIEPLLDGRPREPTLHGLRAKLKEKPFAAVLHRGEPVGFQGDLRAFHVGLVFPVYVRRYRLEAREAGQSQDLAQPVELDDRLDAVAALGAAPSSLGQPAGVKIWIYGNVVTKSLGRGEQRLQLDLLHGLLAAPAALGLADGLEDLRITKRSEFLRDLRLLL